VRGGRDDSLGWLKVDAIDVGLSDDAVMYRREDHVEVGYRRAVKSGVVACCHGRRRATESRYRQL